MRRFLIASTKYHGDIEVVYDGEKLYSLSFAEAIIGSETISDFKRALPVQFSDFERGKWSSSNTVIIEKEFEVSLEDFKREYPYKRNTHLLAPIWDRMGKAAKLQALQAAKLYRKYYEKNIRWYKPMIAASWLNNKEYLNDWGKL